MSTALFYFSGTGNSLIIARNVQQKTDGKLIPIASLIDRDEIRVDYDNIGIITPVYYADLPNIVISFLRKLKGVEGKYIFLVCNYGGSRGYSDNTASNILEQNGGKLSMTYAIHMPQNAFRKPWEKYDKLYAGANKLLSRIDENIANKRKGLIVSNRVLDLVLKPMNPIFKFMFRKQITKIAGLDSDSSIEEAIYNMDKTCHTSDSCNGCGICKQVCPVGNIDIIDGKPRWLHHCENCLACYNWCPNKAIHSEFSNSGYFYRHPDIKISDMTYQKKGNI